MQARAPAIAYGLLLVLAFAAGWLVNGWRADARIARVEVSQSKQTSEQSLQAQAATEKKAEAVITHGAAQQENTHDYTQEMAQLQAGRAADAARIAGVQHDIRAAATRNAQLASDAAAFRDLADQHERLAALAAEGVELVSEADGLVARRDAQVALLRAQVATDRKLLEREMQE
ncbi:hypothetical protein [Comamonas thiooxydans]|uniref:hypothetical protein n=1 Tax=Comamonas thiooxydans TaxID=363952 RepID=UPI0021148993|nr:hypothetical protein [Comamonas thiooxydans]UUE94301.1 hypothetical protein MJ608_01060 [Comamonas thiooxydans]